MPSEKLLSGAFMKDIRFILELGAIFTLFLALSVVSATSIISINEKFDSVITTNGIENRSLGIAVEIPYPPQYESIREGCRFEYIYDRAELTKYYSLPFDVSLDELKARMSLEPDLFVIEEKDSLRNKQGLCVSFNSQCSQTGRSGGCTRENLSSSVTVRLGGGSTNFGDTQPAIQVQPILCPNDRILSECERTNITKYVDVTYIFDMGYNVTVSEPYTFEKEECYKLIQHFGGENCSEIINSTRSVPTTTTGEPVPVGMKVVECPRCPSVCERKPPVNLTCGACICPGNQGFCDSSGERSVVNDTPVYCANELLLIQKMDNQTCQNNFECLSNFCSKGECYDVRSNVENQASIIDRILNWIKRLF